MMSIPPGWYAVCRSEDVRGSPKGVELGDFPVVLFRDRNSTLGALVDRCPHRNAPLSAGRVTGGTLECAYHGWRFGVDGTCTFAAGISVGEITQACHASPVPVREQQGFVWVCTDPGTAEKTVPYRFRSLDDPAYSTGHVVLDTAGSVRAVAENILDVPHTAYLHAGLFRKPRSGEERRAEIRRYGDRVEAEYFGESRPTGLVGRMLAPGGGTVHHVDRFLLPSVTEVEYRLGNSTELNVAVALTPLDSQKTRLFVVVGFRVPVGKHLIRLLLRSVLLRIFRQDAVMLERQAENIRRFGEERFVTTQADVLAPEIVRLLRSAQARDAGETGDVPVVRSVRILF